MENHAPFQKPTVIVIAGYVGSGKSTIATNLSKRLENAPILIFDHYEKYIEWPQDMNRWMSEGSDPDQIRVPKLKEDILSLLKGIPVTDPMDGRIINPSECILLEEPSGGTREEIRNFIDYVVYIDTPQDMCVIRLVERLIDLNIWNTKGTFNAEPKEDLVRQLDAVALWLMHYGRSRSMYMLGSHMAQQNADIVVDGMKTVEEITTDILNEIKEKDSFKEVNK